MSTSQELDRIIVVLNQPRDPVNIGSVVRVMKNMGLSRLHLVRPTDFDTYRIQGVAHTGRDIIESAVLFESVREAVRDAQFVIGTTARGRRVRRSYQRPREAAMEARQKAAAGSQVALVFGREDRGLSNKDLDLCERVIVIPTDPDHSSLNLAQAFLIVAYELFLAANMDLPFKAPRHGAAPATSSDLEDLCWEAEASLHGVNFFKSHNVVPIMRTVREVVARADLDESEAALLRAMAIEVRNFLARHGLD